MKFITYLLFWILPLPSIAQMAFHPSDYKVDFYKLSSKAESLIGLRSFIENNRQYFLTVDPHTFETKIVPSNLYSYKKMSWPDIEKTYQNTPYIRAIQQLKTTANQLQDAGIDHAIPKEKGITLTIDLCPSHKPLDRIIFNDLFAEFGKIESPVPLAISVSGRWILKHQPDLNWLKSLEQQRKLKISWINHSYNHEVNKLPLKENFLLAPGTNLNTEVLKNEQLMIENGLIPSAFFRFPGLVSDPEIFFRITEFGLLPVGSDAWLAKGQQAHKGSIVLIHGNGNEELGVRDFINLLKNEQVDVRNKQWLLFDIDQGLKNEF